MKTIFKLGNNKFLLEPYKTKHELELLEYITANDLTHSEQLDTLTLFLKDHVISSIDLEDLELEEKIILFLKLRELTLGGEIKIKYSCTNCSRPQDNILEFSKIFFPRTKENYENLKINFKASSLEEVEYIKATDIFNDIDDLDYSEYKKLEEIKDEFIDIYNLNPKVKCGYCNNENTISLYDLNLILSSVSEESFFSLSKTIHVIVYFGKHTRSDVLEMTPLERVFELSIIKEFASEMKKSKDQKSFNPF